MDTSPAMAEQTPINSPALEAIVNEADRIEEDSLYSAKGHWETSRECEWLHLALGIPATIAAAVAGVSVISDGDILAAALAVISAILAGLLTFLDPKGRASNHRDMGNSYKALSNDARIFRQVTCRDDTPHGELKRKLEKLNRRRNMLNAKSPQPSRLAFKRARKGIEDGEASYRADTPPASTGR